MCGTGWIGLDWGTDDRSAPKTRANQRTKKKGMGRPILKRTPRLRVSAMRHARDTGCSRPAGTQPQPTTHSHAHPAAQASATDSRFDRCGRWRPPLPDPIGSSIDQDPPTTRHGRRRPAAPAAGAGGGAGAAGAPRLRRAAAGGARARGGGREAVGHAGDYSEVCGGWGPPSSRRTKRFY